MLNVTAASDIFTQDLEDLPHEGTPPAETVTHTTLRTDNLTQSATGVITIKETSEEEASRLFRQEPDEAPEPVLQPNDKPMELVDRAVLIGRIKGAADKAKLTTAQKAEYQREYLGGASVEKADIGALSDLLAAIRKRL